MSISEVACRCVLLSIISVLLSSLAFAESGPSLGEPVALEEIVKWDISIAPDGLNLPPGEGDARLGKEVYRQHCVRCHGDGAEGGDGLADPLVGGVGSLDTEVPIRTVGSYWPYATTVFDYVRRAMPYDLPMSLTNDDAYAVTAYVLALNDIIKITDVVNAETLPKIKMPNRSGFVIHWPGSN